MKTNALNRKAIERNLRGSFFALTKLYKMEKTLNAHENGNNANTLLATVPCPNCKETIEQCACMRNICHKCGKPAGNITFTICDECWEIEFPPKY